MYKAYEDKMKNNVALSIFKIEISALVFFFGTECIEYVRGQLNSFCQRAIIAKARFTDTWQNVSFLLRQH